MLKQETSQKGNVVELSNDWQQVGGLLDNVLSRLQVVPAGSGAVSAVGQGEKKQKQAARRAPCYARQAA